MSQSLSVSQWSKEVSSHFPRLSKPQACVLALYSLGILLAGECGSTQVAQCVADLLHQPWQDCRERLREYRKEASTKTGVKKGNHRQEVQVDACFAPLLQWVLSCLRAPERQLVLVLDASTLSDRFVVLCASVVIRGCAIPVAWHIRPAHEPGSWKPIWFHLLAQLHEAIPPEWQVLVMTDRGLYAKWLYREIQLYHWHPFMRLNVNIKARPEGCPRGTPFEWVGRLVPHINSEWSGKVTCFANKDTRVHATLLAHWEPSYTDPWFILTDPIWNPSRLRPSGMACAVGLNVDVRTSSAVGGIGKGHVFVMQGGWNVCGWRWRWPACWRWFWEVTRKSSTRVPISTTCRRPTLLVAMRWQPKSAGKQPNKRLSPEASLLLSSNPQKRQLSCFRRGGLLVRCFFFSGGTVSTLETLGVSMEPLPSRPALPVVGGFWGTG